MAMVMSMATGCSVAPPPPVIGRLRVASLTQAPGCSAGLRPTSLTPTLFVYRMRSLSTL